MTDLQRRHLAECCAEFIRCERALERSQAQVAAGRGDPVNAQVKNRLMDTAYRALVEVLREIQIEENGTRPRRVGKSKL